MGQTDFNKQVNNTASFIVDFVTETCPFLKQWTLEKLAKDSSIQILQEFVTRVEEYKKWHNSYKQLITEDGDYSEAMGSKKMKNLFQIDKDKFLE